MAALQIAGKQHFKVHKRSHADKKVIMLGTASNLRILSVWVCPLVFLLAATA